MGVDFNAILPMLAVGSSAASGVFNARAARAQGRAAQKAANLNAQAAEYEANAQASRIRTEGRRELGRQRALIGTSGLQAAGSPLELLAQNASEIERQAMETTLAGRYAADVERSRGKVARKTASRVSAASLLEGGTKAVYYGHRLL